MAFNIFTHNGIIAAKSLKTGEHRTFKIWRQPEETNFFPGERLIGLLAGSDNESDYRAFGVIKDDGIILWKKHRGSTFYEWAANAVTHPDRFEHQVSWSFEGHCRRCNRLLTTPESVANGIGPVCAAAEPYAYQLAGHPSEYDLEPQQPHPDDFTQSNHP